VVLYSFKLTPIVAVRMSTAMRLLRRRTTLCGPANSCDREAGHGRTHRSPTIGWTRTVRLWPPACHTERSAVAVKHRRQAAACAALLSMPWLSMARGGQRLLLRPTHQLPEQHRSVDRSHNSACTFVRARRFADTGSASLRALSHFSTKPPIGSSSPPPAVLAARHVFLIDSNGTCM
jgi:hypothetical protein